MTWRELGPLGAAAVLLLAGAVRVAQGGGEGWPLFGLGSVCLGAWLAITVRRPPGSDDEENRP